MAEYPQLTTMSSIPETEDPYGSLMRFYRARNSLLVKEAGNRYGMWEVLPKPIPLTKRQKVYALCHHCNKEFLVGLPDLRNGKSRGCKGFGNANPFYATLPPAVCRTLQARYNRITSCTDPQGTNPAYRAYRVRGTQNRFPSCEAFVRYVWAELPHKDYKGVEIGRIDNLGHYEPGNLQLETREQNAQNRECNIMVEYRGERMSAQKFHRVAKLTCHVATVYNRLKKGHTVETILSLFSTS